MTSPGAQSLSAAGRSANGYRPPAGLSTPLPTYGRPRGYIALAVMLIVGLAALGYWLYGQAGSKTEVLTAAREIPAGHVVTASDLATTEVSGGITAVAAAHTSEVVGRTAAVAILPGTPVQLAMVTSASPVGASQALVGVAAAPGQVPSSGLSPGDTVQVLQLPQKTAAAEAVRSPVLATATVFDVRADPAVEGGTLLTLVAPRTAAYAITAASDAGLVALVQVGAAR